MNPQSTRMPSIGLVTDHKLSTTGAWVNVLNDAIPHSYNRAIVEAGGVPVLFPPLEAYRDAPERALDLIDGLFLPGGRDIDADLYGQQAHETNDAPFRLRDEVEIALVLAARDRGMPIFGACRGMQVMNVALGGTLTQHLEDHVDMTPHRDVVGVFTGHPVRPVEGTLLQQLVGDREFEIASHHHQAVDRLGSGLVASATAPDGTVEALEGDDSAFCFGVQWHPEERLVPEGLALVRAFVRAATDYANR